jgi:hypothetical protein
VPIAATPAATAAFFAVRLSFGRRVFFAAPLALVLFGLERARFDKVQLDPRASADRQDRKGLAAHLVLPGLR